MCEAVRVRSRCREAWLTCVYARPTRFPSKTWHLTWQSQVGKFELHSSRSSESASRRAWHARQSTSENTRQGIAKQRAELPVCCSRSCSASSVDSRPRLTVDLALHQQAMTHSLAMASSCGARRWSTVSSTAAALALAPAISDRNATAPRTTQWQHRDIAAHHHHHLCSTSWQTPRAREPAEASCVTPSTWDNASTGASLNWATQA